MTEGKKNGELLGSDSRRFALLYNVEGLKYTIGQCFQSRRRQGEYLFCYGRKGVAKTSHCEITCGSEGQFWVKDLQGLSGNGTFVNGERIYDRAELKFGDILALGDPNPKQDPVNEIQMELDEDEVLSDDGGFTSFLFVAVEESANAQDEGLVGSQESSQGSHLERNVLVESTPLTNALVISQILGYLRLSDVKKCRLVCSLWNEEATKYLKSNSVTRFNYHNIHMMHSSFPSVTMSSRLFAFVQEIGRFFPRGRFYITLPSCVLPNCVCRGCKESFNHWGSDIDIRRNSERKLVSDLKWFFGGGFVHPITKLSLTGTIQHKPGSELMAAILKGCSLHLDDLTLSMNINFNPDSNTVVPFRVHFPSLKKLEIKVQHRTGYSGSADADSDDDDDDWLDHNDNLMDKWSTSMITSAPHLQSLKLTNWALFQSFGEAFLDKVIKVKGFPNLNSLELLSYNYEVLSSILQLPKMKSLKLGISFPDFEDDEGRYDQDDDENEPLPAWTVVMSNVLNKSAVTLKFLDLTLPDLRGRNRASISLPVFSNLTLFKLHKFYANCLVLSDSGTSFKTHFPNLQNFFVYAMESDFFNVFFHDADVGPCAKANDMGGGEQDVDEDDEDEKESQTSLPLWNYQTTRKKLVKEEHVVKSVRLLEIEIGDWSRVGVDKMDKLFPNAFNKDLETVRAKELARPRWSWSKWSFVAGTDLRPVKLKKNN